MNVIPKKSGELMAGLYIHVPFCHAKCAYCDFYSKRLDTASVSSFVDNLRNEWEQRKNEVENIQTVYFGGGTPSILSVAQIESIFEWLPKLNTGDEFTVEFNPEDVDSSILDAWRSIGANRVSMGIQSLNDGELRTVGRRHSASQALQSYGLLRRRFENVSVDIIIGLPGQTLETLVSTLATVISLRPEHVSVYILSYEHGTRLWAMRQSGKIAEADDELVEMMYKLVCTELKAAGYLHYEISNFAIPGKEAVHNSNYWQGVPYIGLGPGAHSYDGAVRRFNPADLRLWGTLIESGQVAYTIEEESIVDKINNSIMTGLRTASGINLNAVDDKFRAAIIKNLEKISPDRYRLENNMLTIPESAWLVSDDTISRLFIE